MPRRVDGHLDELLAGLTALVGRPATAEDRRSFQQYLDVFLRWNQVHRMTSLASQEDIVRDLFLDSLLLFKLLPPRPLAVVDIGAGAGIPGLPIRLADRGIQLTLVESRRKRVSFLRAVCRELGLTDVTVKESRAEALIVDEPSFSDVFDVAVARAVGPIRALVPIAFKYLKPGGLLIVSGSPRLTAQAPVGVIQILVPGATRARSFHTARKESNVPRGTWS